MKIYLVDAGAYENNEIVAVFFSEDKAQSCANARNDDMKKAYGQHIHQFGKAYVTERDTEDEPEVIHAPV